MTVTSCAVAPALPELAPPSVTSPVAALAPTALRAATRPATSASVAADPVAARVTSPEPVSVAGAVALTAMLPTVTLLPPSLSVSSKVTSAPLASPCWSSTAPPPAMP